MLLINRLLRGHGCDRCRPGPAVQVERPQRGEDGLDGGENVGGRLDLPAGSCEVGAVAITEGDRTPRAAARSFCAYCSGCNTRWASPGVTALYPRDGEREDCLGEQCLTLPGVRVEVSSNDRRWRAAVEGTRPGHSCHRTLCEDRSTARLLLCVPKMSSMVLTSSALQQGPESWCSQDRDPGLVYGSLIPSASQDPARRGALPAAGSPADFRPRGIGPRSYGLAGICAV